MIGVRLRWLCAAMIELALSEHGTGGPLPCTRMVHIRAAVSGWWVW